MFTYNSHQKSPTRAFDFLYDPTFLGSTKIAKCKSIKKMSPTHVLPSYCNMFSDTKRRNYVFSQRNPLPLNANISCPKVSHNIPLDKNIFVFHQHPCMKKSCSHTFVLSSKINTSIEQKMKHSVKCQTIFRESECQTEIWEPEPKLSANTKSMPEILYVKCENYPGEREVRKIERDRIRREWENILSKMSVETVNMNERIEQLRMFMLEDILLHEKELNEDQEQRMEYVYEALNNRDEENEKITRECIERILETYKRIKGEKSRKLIKNHERRLNRLMRKSSTVINEKSFIKNVNSFKNIKMNVPYTDFNDIPPKNSKNNLSAPRKSKTNLFYIKEFEQFGEISRISKSKKSLPKCLKIKENYIESNNEDLNIKDKENEIYEDCVLLQKTIKGVIAQRRILDGMHKSMFMMKCYQKMYPLRCVTDFLPEKCEEEQKIENKTEQESVEIKIANIKNEKKIEVENLSKTHANDIVSEIIDDSLKRTHDEWNKKMLHLANQEREQRKKLAEIEEMQQKLKNARTEIMKSKINEMYDEIANDLIDKITPVVIEMIAEKDARKYVLELAEEISQRAFTNDFNTVNEILNEILLPLIISKLPPDNEHLIALLGSYDAFQDFLNENFSQ
ncbi:hypothetical protein PVAND_005878 [Polypedilum vanderplanki]|uniref:Cilia- and flagella-associated protein 91 n=1 Tax=Polypedilum vanderplanki TaxID=319348 RepID=A0A9J6C1V7_POLVA|nr:hypothetical protein PVAND_005878 [Polypedilum vanderplanki]